VTRDAESEEATASVGAVAPSPMAVGYEMQ